MNLKGLRFLFPPAPPVHGEKEKSVLHRKAASLTSTGNVLVQLGHFATKQDLNVRKKKLLLNV